MLQINQSLCWVSIRIFLMSCFKEFFPKWHWMEGQWFSQWQWSHHDRAWLLRGVVLLFCYLYCHFASQGAFPIYKLERTLVSSLKRKFGHLDINLTKIFSVCTRKRKEYIYRCLPSVVLTILLAWTELFSDSAWVAVYWWVK